MADWTYKLDIDMLERNGTSACLAATRAMIARIRELEAALERASQPGSGETVKVDAVHANFTPFYIMSNVRRICAQYYNNHRANWVLAMDVFAVGSRSARQICLDAGIDPDGYTVIRVSTGDTARASLDGRREG